MTPEKINQKCKRQIKRRRKDKGCKDRKQQLGSLRKKTRQELCPATATGKIRKAQGCVTSTNQKSSVQPSGPGGRDARAGLLKRVDGDWPQLVLGCPPVSYRGESNKSAPDAQESQDHTGEANIKEQNQHFGFTIQIWIFNADILELNKF